MGTYTIQKIGKMYEKRGCPIFILLLMIVGAVIITLLRWIGIIKQLKYGERKNGKHTRETKIY